MSPVQASPKTDPFLGRALDGRYVLRARLGEGGMGTVYEAENLLIGRRVAIKVLSPDLARHPDALVRFRREARAAARVQHPNIVEILDMCQTDAGLPYIVMELLDGEDLLAVLSRETRLPAPRAMRIAVQVLRAVRALHRAGVLHRDLKPENVFLTRRGGRSDVVKLLDFGVAHLAVGADAASVRLTRSGMCVGTPSYMSPELARGKRDVDVRTDVYSVGVVLYEMLSGRLPHPGDSYNEVLVAVASTAPPPLRKVAPWVAPEIAAVVDRAMARDPEARHASAGELLAALAPFVGRGDAPHVLHTGIRTAAPTPERPTRRLGWIAATLGVAAVGALVVAPTSTSESLQATSAHRISFDLPPRTLTPTVAPFGTSPPVARVTLAVETALPEARVFLDGQLLGVSSIETRIAMDRRSHLLLVQADGFLDQERWITLDGPVRLSIAELIPLPARRRPTRATSPGMLPPSEGDPFVVASPAPEVPAAEPENIRTNPYG